MAALLLAGCGGPHGAKPPAVSKVRTSGQAAPPKAPASSSGEYSEALAVGDATLRSGAAPAQVPIAGLSVGLVVESVAKGHGSDADAIGNHAQILSAQRVQAPAGPAYFALVRRTSAAASGSTAPQYEYWVILLRTDPARSDMDIAYCIEAKVQSGGATAQEKAALLGLLPHWRVPAPK